jgi:two-component system chemotaxis response regulator CheY
MPIMNGMECLKKLRAQQDIKQPKVIFCTTETDMKNILEAMQNGADEYVMKPFDSEIITTKFAQVGLL